MCGFTKHTEASPVVTFPDPHKDVHAPESTALQANIRELTSSDCSRGVLEKFVENGT